MRALASLCLLTVLCAAPLGAQRVESPAVTPGERVRVSLLMEDHRLAGRLQAVGSDTLLLQVGREPTARSVPLASMQRLEVSRGRPRALWTLGGAFSGAAAGVLYTRAFAESDPGDIGGVQGTVDGIANTLAGMVAGAALGWFIAPERWSSVPLPAPTR